jgi:hypothetical protein
MASVPTTGADPEQAAEVAAEAGVTPRPPTARPR